MEIIVFLVGQFCVGSLVYTFGVLIKPLSEVRPITNVDQTHEINPYFQCKKAGLFLTILFMSFFRSPLTLNDADKLLSLIPEDRPRDKLDMTSRSLEALALKPGVDYPATSTLVFTTKGAEVSINLS